jgi:hypothetical protein
MYEYVCVGDPEAVGRHRSLWLGLVEDMLRELHLDVTRAIANDPFFGRPGKLLASSQRESERKIELVVQLYDGREPTAVASGNLHADHFGSAFAIQTVDGQVAHSSCVGLGVDRVALALFKTHGLDVGAWPAALRQILDFQD